MSSIRKGSALLFVVFCLSVNAASALAVSTLDQQYVPNSYPASTDISYMYSAAQTFTAGASGLLTQIDLYLSRDRYNYTDTGWQNGYDLMVDVRPVDATGTPLYPDTSALGGVVVPWQNIVIIPNGADWNSIDFSSANISVTAGTTYAIVLRSGGSSGVQFRWYGGTSTIVDGQLVLPYSGHPSFRRDVVNYTNWMAPDSHDAYGFKTYVDVAPVPIPGALVLFGSGLMGLVGIGRRRLKK